jgi:Fic family protein
MKFKIITSSLLADYKTQMRSSSAQIFHNLSESPLSADTFSFYTSVSAVFSSKIEGEAIELDSYIKHKKLGIKFLADYTRKIDDLYSAYNFAQNHPLNAKNLAKAHQLLTKNILAASQRGKVRTSNMFVITDDGRIECVAVTPDAVKIELKKLYDDMNQLIINDLTFAETCFFAAMIHLVFLKIHPFDDGNGRTARLLEKWFLASKLGYRAWFVQSEKYYYQNHSQYYNYIRRLGLEYPSLDYEKALPFLLMLPQALQFTK